MNRRNLSWALALHLTLGVPAAGLAAFGLAACGGEEASESASQETTHEGEPPEAEAEAEEAAEAAPEAPEISAEEIPVEDDFADEASEQINGENYDAELAALEQEIQAEAGEGEANE